MKQERKKRQEVRKYGRIRKRGSKEGYRWEGKKRAREDKKVLVKLLSKRESQEKSFIL